MMARRERPLRNLRGTARTGSGDCAPPGRRNPGMRRPDRAMRERPPSPSTPCSSPMAAPHTPAHEPGAGSGWQRNAKPRPKKRCDGLERGMSREAFSASPTPPCLGGQPPPTPRPSHRSQEFSTLSSPGSSFCRGGATRTATTGRHGPSVWMPCRPAIDPPTFWNTRSGWTNWASQATIPRRGRWSASRSRSPAT